MSSGFDKLDWSLVRAFLAVADEGSLSAAAKRLGLTQPTLGRQVRALEQSLGVTLLHRHAKGFHLTADAVALLPSARAMREAAARLSMASDGGDDRIDGTVRISASVAVSVWHLPKIIASLMEETPGLAIELEPTDQSSNLLYREADIAIRMYRPVQLDLVTRHIGDLGFGAFAAKRYLDRRGTPSGLQELQGHDFVGLDRGTLLLDGMKALGLDANRDWFRARTDETATNWALVKAGCGIGFAQRAVGRAEPLVQEIDLGVPLPKLPVWLSAHPEMRRSRRIRHVWDALAEGLGRLVD